MGIFSRRNLLHFTSPLLSFFGYLSKKMDQSQTPMIDDSRPAALPSDHVVPVAPPSGGYPGVPAAPRTSEPCMPIWLIVVLALLAVGAAGALLWVFVLRDKTTQRATKLKDMGLEFIEMAKDIASANPEPGTKPPANAEALKKKFKTLILESLKLLTELQDEIIPIFSGEDPKLIKATVAKLDPFEVLQNAAKTIEEDEKKAVRNSWIFQDLQKDPKIKYAVIQLQKRFQEIIRAFVRAALAGKMKVPGGKIPGVPENIPGVTGGKIPGLPGSVSRGESDFSAEESSLFDLARTISQAAEAFAN